MKVFEKVMYPALVVLLFFYTYHARTNPRYFEEQLAVEGGPLQWSIIATLFFASAMCIYRARILEPFRGKTFSTCLLIFGFLFFIFGLDEMSWGQILFHYPTPDFIAVRNSMGEMNIRHFLFNGFEINDLIFTLTIKILATLYFIVLPLLYLRVERIKKGVNRFAIPVPRYTQTGAYIITALWMGLFPSPLRYIVFEFVFYWIFVLMIYNPLNDEVFSRKTLSR